MLMGKQVAQAREAITSAAADTKQAIIVIGVFALAALAVGVLALVVALTGKRVAHG